MIDLKEMVVIGGVSPFVVVVSSVITSLEFTSVFSPEAHEINNSKIRIYFFI